MRSARFPSVARSGGEGVARRLDVVVRGAVQGVGFRPFVYRLAHELDLTGWVRNEAGGVRIAVEGPDGAIATFAARLRDRPPPRAVVCEVLVRPGEPEGFGRFTIRRSDAAGRKVAFVLPDIATCPDCLAEILDPADRRHRYPFTNCTNCGPRFSIIRRLPYDRPGTTMRAFRMCPGCRAEYEDPLDRRFHAQPNACPACGPGLTLIEAGARRLAGNEVALAGAARLAREGRILALKGLGGYQLLVDATDPDAVRRLRRRKRRPRKPLALMVADLDAARSLARLDDDEASLLASPDAPIVLVRRRGETPLAAAVAPDTDRLGIMLPTTPLHHLLLRDVGRPVVATSGNLSEEPICIDEHEAMTRLGGIADAFLIHDRPIERHVDDSVLWVFRGEPRPLRRARGLAPLPVGLTTEGPDVLAVGAHQKNAVALALGAQAFVSQHIGDLTSLESRSVFEVVIADLLGLYEAAPTLVVHDLHPDYASSAWAEAATAPDAEGPLAGLPRVAVQHHHAHLAACLAEHRVEGPALGVVWDGTGLGDDGTVWGGEGLLGEAGGYVRVARLLPFRLPGGEAAVREPWRVASSLAREVHEAGLITELPALEGVPPAARGNVELLLERGVRSPWTSSVGRLFDGVACLAGLGLEASYEGQLAVALEHCAGDRDEAPYPFPLLESTDHDGPGAPPELAHDWRPLVAAVIEDRARGVDRDVVAARFHGALRAGIEALARRVGEPRVVLTGGCFQNRRLVSTVAASLEAAGHELLLHRQVPPNDGGIALGQVAVGRARGVAGGATAGGRIAGAGTAGGGTAGGGGG